jgi:hypothetical protein
VDIILELLSAPNLILMQRHRLHAGLAAGIDPLHDQVHAKATGDGGSQVAVPKAALLARDTIEMCSQWGAPLGVLCVDKLVCDARDVPLHAGPDRTSQSLGLWRCYNPQSLDKGCSSRLRALRSAFACYQHLRVTHAPAQMCKTRHDGALKSCIFRRVNIVYPWLSRRTSAYMSV